MPVCQSASCEWHANGLLEFIKEKSIRRRFVAHDLGDTPAGISIHLLSVAKDLRKPRMVKSLIPGAASALL